MGYGEYNKMRTYVGVVYRVNIAKRELYQS